MITIFGVIIIAGILLFTIKLGCKEMNTLTKLGKIHLVIVSLINLIVVGKLLSVTMNGNDKAIIFLIFGYVFLIILNGLVWLVLHLAKKKACKIYKILTFGLVFLFPPTLILSTVFEC